MKRIIKLNSGGELAFNTDDLLGEPGTQGAVYKTELFNLSVAVKVYHANAWIKIEERTRYLVKQHDVQLIPNLCLPLSIGQCSDTGDFAVIMPYVDAIPFDQFLEEEMPDIVKRVEMSIQFMQLCNLLEEKGIAHGDLSYSNVVVDRATHQIYLIDLDNFICCDNTICYPPAFGTYELISPELRQGFHNNNNNCNRNNHQTPIPTIFSERFSYAIVLSELLLNQHPAADAKDPGDFFNLMVAGDFPTFDSANERLSTELFELFHNSFSLKVENRPTAKHWLNTLLVIVANQSLVIHSCGTPQFISKEDELCRHCGNLLVLQHGMTLVLHEGNGNLNTIEADCFVGRNDFIDSPLTISSRHLKFRCNGIDWFMTPVGRNQTGAWTARALDWVPLENGKEYRLAKQYFPLKLWVGGHKAVLEQTAV